MKKLFPLFIILTFAIYSCSSSLKVYTTHDKNADLGSYKTFDFYEIKEDHLKMKEVNRRRLAMAIEIEYGNTILNVSKFKGNLSL